MPARGEVEISVIAEDLKLLTNFLFYVPVVRVELTQLWFKSVNIVQIEFAFANRLDAVHDFDEPASRFSAFIPKEKRSLPLG